MSTAQRPPHPQTDSGQFVTSWLKTSPDLQEEVRRAKAARADACDAAIKHDTSAIKRKDIEAMHGADEAAA